MSAWPVVGVLALARVDACNFCRSARFYTSLARPVNVLHFCARLARIGGASALLFSPWLCYNLFLTGSPIPVSGLSLAVDSGTGTLSAKLHSAAGSLAQNAFPAFWQSSTTASARLFVVAAAYAIRLALRAHQRDRHETADGRFLYPLSPMADVVAAYLAALVASTPSPNSAAISFHDTSSFWQCFRRAYFAFLLYRLAISRWHGSRRPSQSARRAFSS